MKAVWQAHGIGSGCYLPLSTPERRLGTLIFARRASKAYCPGDLEFLTQVARQVAVSVDRAHRQDVNGLCG